MRERLFAAGALVAALLIAFLASQPPAAQPASAPPAAFSAGRAMADVRAISRAPRPTGSVENARVRSYLLARMRQLGMALQVQTGPLSASGAERLRDRGKLNLVSATAVNLIGVLPGRDRGKPAILLMAHHDSVAASPGAADDAAGVAAGLEIVRATKARGQPARDLVLLLTDAEEVGLDGARMFFSAHPLARRIGTVINMESRGGGGRTAMFETGASNGRLMHLYRHSVSRPFSNSLAVLVYGLMPNNTDFTISRSLGLPGFNFAFIGDAQYYHSPAAVADALDPRTLQDLGAQALEVTDALAFSSELPESSADAVFGDVLGLFVIVYPAPAGWLLLAITAGFIGFALFRVRRAGQVDRAGILGGTAVTLAFLLHIALALRVFNLLSGSAGRPNYYDRLAALPRLELQAALLCLAALLLACFAARPAQRFLAAAPALLLLGIGVALGGLLPLILELGVAAAVSALLLPRRCPGLWDGWFGFAVLLFLLGLGVQAIAPTAAPLLHWSLLLFGLAAAAAAWLDPTLHRPASLAIVAVPAALGVGQLLYLAHFTFLGVGAPIPETMAGYALIAGLLLWPLLEGAAQPRTYGLLAGLLVLAATVTALSVRLDPMAQTIPPYSQKS